MLPSVDKLQETFLSEALASKNLKVLITFARVLKHCFHMSSQENVSHAGDM